MNIKNQSEVRELLERIIHKYSQMEKQKRDYGIGEDFTQAEIHTIAYIGENPGSRQDNLAKAKGITKGAASQMITKLEKRGLVKRGQSKNSNAEVALYLTKKGTEAFKGHIHFHNQVDNSFHQFFTTISEDEYDIFVRILKSCDEVLLKEGV